MEPIPPPFDSRPAALATPRSLGQILDTAFDLLRRNAPLMVGLAALVYVPLGFAMEGAPDAAEAGGLVPEPAPWLLAALALVVVALPIVMAGLTDTCGALLRGRDADAGTALRAGLRLALPLIGTVLVAGLALAVALAPMGLLISAGDSLPMPVRVTGGIGAMLLPVILLLRLSLLTQVIVLERVFGPQALIRANRLIDGHVLRVFGTLFLVGLLMGVLGTAGELALGSLPGVGPAATGLFQAVGFAYTTAVGVVLYADVRVRQGESDEHQTSAAASRFRFPPPGL